MCKLTDGRDWLWGTLGLALVGKAMLSKSLMQFLFMGGLCSLPVVWPEAKYKRNGGNGNLLQKDLCQQASAPRTVVVSALTLW